ncbi:unnamed protein product [marine sediment metagenome]|uniref:Uncharacterized protein n=1 Tax=marine sediment metagenome TaxID=412755 RepID=X1HHP2_9ZZZZ
MEPHIIKLDIELHRIKVEETDNNFVEYFGYKQNGIINQISN